MFDAEFITTDHTSSLITVVNASVKRFGRRNHGDGA